MASDVWMADARCRGCDPNLFFYDRGSHYEMLEALAICKRCAVRDPCLDYAIRNREKFGVFGGKSDRGRRKWRQFLRVTQEAFDADVVPVVDDVAWSFVTEVGIAS